MLGFVLIHVGAATAQSAAETLFFGEDAKQAPLDPLTSKRSRSMDVRDLREGTGSEDAEDTEIDTPLYADFARYVRDTTGKVVSDALPIKRSGVRAPKLPESYVLGSGDEIEIQVWGSLSARYKLRLDDTARVFVPEVGSISLIGVTAGRLTEVMNTGFGRIYKGFEMRAVVSRARAITINVTGQARSVGIKTVSATHTLVSATLNAARPSNGGSRRFVELRRTGAPPLLIDLYCFFRSDCPKIPESLYDGDSIHVPARSALVAITGAVTQPGIYELAPGESASDLLRYAGGVSIAADITNVNLYSFASSNGGSRFLRSVSLPDLCNSTQSMGSRCGGLADGDHLDVQQRPALVQGAVTVVAAGIEGIKIELKPGMRLMDVLKPPFDRLLPPRTRDAMNAGAYATLSELDNRLRRLDLSGLTLQRLDLRTREYVGQSVEYQKAATEPESAANLLLQDGDVLVLDDVVSWKLRRDQQQISVRVMGEVGQPGRYRFLGAKNLRDLLKMAGGLTSDAAPWSAVILRIGDGRSAVNREVLDRALKGITEHQRRQEALNATSGGIASAEMKAAGERVMPNSLQTLASRTQSEVKELMVGREVVYITAKDAAFVSDVVLTHDDVILIPPKVDTFACQGAFFRQGAFDLARGSAPLKDATDRCGLIDEMRPNLYHFVARENRVCRAGWFAGCPDVQGGDAIVAIPDVITKQGTSAVLEWMDVALRALTTLATIQVLSR